MPSTVSGSCLNRVDKNAGNWSAISPFTCRSMSAATSSTRMRHPSCSPKNVTLLPTTGPRSMMVGFSRVCRCLRNLPSALVGLSGSCGSTVFSAAAAPVSSRRRLPRKPNKSENDRVVSDISATPFVCSGADFLPAGSRCRGGRSGASGRSLGRRRLRLSGRALHIDAAAEVSALGNRDARRNDVAVDRAVVANVHLFGCRYVAGYFAQHNDCLREEFGPDLSVGPNSQDVVTEFDAAFDVPLDRQVFAATQLTFDDHRFPYVHLVP